MDKYILLFAIYSRKYSRIWSLSIDITILEAYFSNYYLFVIIRYDIDILGCMYMDIYKKLEYFNPPTENSKYYY